MGLEDKHLDLLQNIEAIVVSVYLRHPGMSDYVVMAALDALIGWYRAEFRKHAQKPVALEELESEVFNGVKTVCEWRLGRADSAGGLPEIQESVKSLDDVIGCLRKIRKSVDRWHDRGGSRGYLEFVSQYV